MTEEMRVSVPIKNISKFKEVFLYILNEVGAKPNVGKTVLSKLLYFIDFDYYELYEEQLMGLEYIKNTYGPAPIDFDELCQQMINDGDIEEVKSVYFYQQKKYLPHRAANINILNAQEIKHIDAILYKYSSWPAERLSNLSCRDVPWIGADEKGSVSYESVFYRTPETSVRAYDVKQLEKKGDINVFSAKKVLQEIAYLLKLNNKRMPLIKLMKELYLIDRLSIDEREISISGDSFFYIMAHGPVLSFTLNMLRDVSRNEWGDYLQAIQTRDYFPDIFINKEMKEDLLGEKEKEYISRISEEFFNYSSDEIEDFTYKLPECSDQKCSSKIKFADIKTALRKKDIRAIKEEYECFFF